MYAVLELTVQLIHTQAHVSIKFYLWFLLCILYWAAKQEFFLCTILIRMQSGPR